jgi:uncharacterized RDD family membrane protein YckC
VRRPGASDQRRPPTPESDLLGACPACSAPISRGHLYSWCTQCGEQLPDSLTDVLENAYTRPAGSQPVAGGIIEDPRVAPFAIRAAARAIDTVIGVVVGFVAMVMAVIVLMARGTAGAPQQWLETVSVMTAASLIASIAGNCVYYIACEWIGGATIGKLACGLRVVSQDFGPLSFRAAIVRTLAFFVDGLFFGLVGYLKMAESPLRQRFGDRWARTLVVKRGQVPTASRGLVASLLGIGCGMGGWCVIQAYSIVLRVLTAA